MTTLLAYGCSRPATAEQPIRHSGAAPENSVTTENFRIGTLYTARQYSIPSADLLGLAQLESGCFEFLHASVLMIRTVFKRESWLVPVLALLAWILQPKFVAGTV